MSVFNYIEYIGSLSSDAQANSYPHRGTRWVFVGLRYFEKVIQAIDSLLCRLHD